MTCVSVRVVVNYFILLPAAAKGDSTAVSGTELLHPNTRDTKRHKQKQRYATRTVYKGSTQRAHEPVLIWKLGGTARKEIQSEGVLGKRPIVLIL